MQNWLEKGTQNQAGPAGSVPSWNKEVEVSDKHLPENLANCGLLNLFQSQLRQIERTLMFCLLILD